jgi:hypothetical protein
MKRRVFAAVLLFAALFVYGQSTEVSLDEAVQNAARHVQEDLDKGSAVIVYQFQSHNPRLSDYVLKELFDKLVNSKLFTVLDRSAQEVVDAELYYQFNKSAGMISDDRLASLTKRIGAKAIITGSLDDTGNDYRFRIRVIGTETTAAIVSYTASVPKDDKRIAGFIIRPSDTSEKIGTGALNILLGLGSYLQGDITGGAIVTGGYVASIALIAWELALSRNDAGAGYLGPVGIGFGAASLVFGFIKPLIFNGSRLASASGGFDIALVSNERNKNALAFLYTRSF